MAHQGPAGKIMIELLKIEGLQQVKNRGERRFSKQTKSHVQMLKAPKIFVNSTSHLEWLKQAKSRQQM